MNHPPITKRFRSLPKITKRASFLLILLGGWSLGLAVGQQDQSAEAPPVDSLHSSVRALIAQGNIFASKYFDNRAALALYNRALTFESGNADLLWHISQAYVDIGEHLPTATDEEKTQQLAAYEKALEFADKSVAANASSSMAFTRRAIALSRVGFFRGFWETVGLLKDVRSDLERAIALDSSNHLAFNALGLAHMRVIERPWIFRWPLGLGWGHRSEALHFFEKAIILKGDFIEYRVNHAKALIEEGEYVKARDQLLLIPALPTQDEDDDRYRREALQLYESVKEEE